MKAFAEMPTDGAGDGGRPARKGNPGYHPEGKRQKLLEEDQL